MSWPVVRLDECCEIVAGATPSTSEAAYWGGDICWATPKDLSDLGSTVISDTPRKLTEAGLRSCAATLLPVRSVLFSSRAPIGHVAINTVPMATNQGFKSFVPKAGQVVPEFLYWWLRYNRAYLESLGNGATFKEVSKAIVSRVEIALPPLEEQRRIAAILDQAETLRTQRRQALAHLDTLTQSLFLDMFGDPVANPKNFVQGVLGDVCDLFNGYAFKSDDYVEVSNTLNCRMSNIRPNGEFDIEYHPKYLPDNYAEEYKRFLLRDGDVIIAMTDMASEVKILGVPTIVDTKGKAVLLNQRVGKLLLRDRVDIDIPFLRQLLAQKYVKSFYQKFASGGVQINLGKSDLLSVPIVLPPLALQQTFATRVQAIEALKTTHRAALAQLDALFASLQQRAFAGEL